MDNSGHHPHEPVLLEETVSQLITELNGIYGGVPAKLIRHRT